jgi:acyl homoserine lactone synthase
MEVVEITCCALAKNSALAFGMHSLRRRVFKDRLDRAVSVTSGLEFDQYDLPEPTYLAGLERHTVIGCVRLLPTTGRNMVANTFSQLLDGRDPPISSRLWESSRFCLDTQTADVMLFAAMIEWGQSRELTAIATVTDLRMERILRRAGWGLDRLGEPRQIAAKAIAGLLPVTDDVLGAIRSAGKISGRAIDNSSSLGLAA